MKIIFCNNINEIPNLSEIHSLTEHNHLCLKFPKRVQLDETLLKLKQNLPDCSIFIGAMNDETITITIKSVIKKQLIIDNLDFVINALTDYIQVSNQLIQNINEDTNWANWENWEVFCEHPPHIEYRNLVTKQFVDTCEYKMYRIEDIDPYFFGKFIKTSPIHTELKDFIKNTFHDTNRILDVIKTIEDLQPIFSEDN